MVRTLTASVAALLISLLAGCASLNQQVQSGNLSGINSANINQQDSAGVTPLMTAARYSPDSVSSLLRQGANVNLRDNENWSALIYAAHYNPQTMRSLLDAGADINAATDTGWSALAQTSRNHPEYVAMLIRAGANIAQANSDGWTPLHIAARYHPEIAADLIAAKAPLNSQTNDGWTPLMLAARFNPSVIPALIKAGADANIANNWGWTPLMLAAASANSTDLQRLIDGGAQVNRTRPNGLTALMNAAAYRPDNIRVLLAAGARSDMRLSESNTFDADWEGTSGRSITASAGSGAADIARLFGNNSSASDLERNGNVAQADNSQWQIASATGTVAAYQEYLKQQPEGLHASEALSRIKTLEDSAAKARASYAAKAARQACKLQDSEWLYQSKSCANGYAQGKGVAINEVKGLRFEGQFDKGQRIEGKLSYGDTLMYEGKLEDGKPHGSGICMHEGEPEECKYYHGKRVDSLYKIRLETEKQRLALEAQQQQIDASLKRNEEAIAQMQAQGVSNSNYAVSDPNSLENMLKREAAKKATDMLFDQLF